MKRSEWGVAATFDNKLGILFMLPRVVNCKLWFGGKGIFGDTINTEPSFGCSDGCFSARRQVVSQ